MTAAAVVATPLNTNFTFSFMRRGGGPKPKGEDGTTGGDGSHQDQPNQQPPQTQQQQQQQQQQQNEVAGQTQTTGIVHPYENSIKTIITVSTVESFWEAYDWLKRPNDLPTTTDYHFFRSGIKPTWEDPSNTKGGKWIVRLPKGLSSRYWEEIILALIGGQFVGVPADEICGAVLSVRYSEDILGVWNKTAADRDLVDRIRDAIKKILLLPTHANMEYKPHQTSIQDRSSFRNTQVWKPKSLESRASTQTETRRATSWGEREERKPKGRDMGRAWR